MIIHTFHDTDAPSRAVLGLHGWTGDEHVFEPIAKFIFVRGWGSVWILYPRYLDERYVVIGIQCDSFRR